MQTSLYVGISAQVALEKRLETIATNVANMSTVGYRADAVKFETVLSRAATDPVAFASPGETFISRKQGAVSKTGNPLDVAVIGDAWLAFSTPEGTVYTTDGRLQMTQQGVLQTVGGHPILDAGGMPLRIDPNGGPVSIAQDGMITQDGNQMGALGLFSIPHDAKLTRVENSGVIPDRPAAAILDFTNTGLSQGHLEGSNINPIQEMSRLILASRTFESMTSLLEKSEASLERAVRALGETS